MRKPCIAYIAAKDNLKFLMRYGISFVIIMVLFLALIISTIIRFPEDYNPNFYSTLLQAFLYSLLFALMIVGTANGIRIVLALQPSIKEFAQKHNKMFLRIIIIFLIIIQIFSAAMMVVGILTLIPLFIYHVRQLLKVKRK